MCRLGWLIALAVFVSPACGGGSDEVSTIDVATLVSGNTVRDVVVEGAVVWDDSGARLCQALMESFPAQCGSPSVPISNPDAVDAAFDESGGRRASWSLPGSTMARSSRSGERDVCGHRQ